MNIESIMLLLGILFLTIAYISRPFVLSKTGSGDKSGSEFELKAEREHLILNIQDLDFDYQMGKIPQADYPLRRTELMERGAKIMAQLDRKLPRPPSNLPATKITDKSIDYDELIEDMIVKRRSSQKEQTGGFCPDCGKVVLITDRFCPNCGHAIEGKGKQLGKPRK
jgi:hypothetical protein